MPATSDTIELSAIEAREMLSKALHDVVPDSLDLKMLVNKIQPNIWSELPLGVTTKQAIRILIELAISRGWATELVIEISRIAPRNPIIIDLQERLTQEPTLFHHATDSPRTTAAPGVRRKWRARIEHPLQPAIHFTGRRELIRTLNGWLAEPRSSTRVVSLIAVGGTGKTAVVEHLLRDLRDSELLGGLFVWSFYENNRTEDFLQRACEYFALLVPEDAQGRLYHLQETLRDGRPHLLVLDGIELIQEAQQASQTVRPRGSLKDPLLKLLLRSLADGLGRSRAIITSRFPLPDLRPWEGEHRQHWPVSLESLDEEAAVALLSAFGVRGEHAELAALAANLGYHALSVAVLAAYLSEVCGGDPRGATQFDLQSMGSDDALASKLSRVLSGYAAALSEDERRALALLSTLPRGVHAEKLCSLMERAPLKDVAGMVGGESPIHKALDWKATRIVGTAAVQAHLERLKKAGLVFSYREPEGGRSSPPRVIYTAHPFVRDYFRNLVDVAAVNLELAELVRPTATNLPGSQPSSMEDLDRVEQFIEHLVLAGERSAALDAYRWSLGGYDQLARINEHVRGRRTLELVAGAELPDEYYPLRELGHYAHAMGELDHAEQLYEKARSIFVQETMLLDDLYEEADDFALLYLSRGTLPRAAWPLPLLRPSLGLQSIIDLLCMGGRIGNAVALAGFAPGVLSAPWSDTIREGLLTGLDSSPEAMVASGLLALPADPVRARSELLRLRNWLSTSGPPRMILAGHYLAADLALKTGDLKNSLRESISGIHLADACGFGLFAIDLRIMRAQALLASGATRDAYDTTVDVLTRAEDPRCGYLWGVADAWYFQALALRTVDLDGSRSSLEHAARLQTHLDHPRLEQSNTMLSEIGSA